MFLFVFNCAIDIICPLQMWNPNKTFERLRATVCLCAQNIINKLTFYDDTILKQVIFSLYIVKSEINFNIKCCSRVFQYFWH